MQVTTSNALWMPLGKQAKPDTLASSATQFITVMMIQAAYRL